MPGIRILFCLFALSLTACGILTAPVSVPEAIAQNANFSFKGNVVDVDGKPLAGVTMKQTLRHLFWDPIGNKRSTNEIKYRLIDAPFSVAERGVSLEMVFSREGYFDAYCTMGAADPGIVQFNYLSNNGLLGYQRWPDGGGMAVVMIRRNTVKAELLATSISFPSDQYPRLWATRLAFLEKDPPNQGRFPFLTAEFIAGKPETLPPWTLYMDFIPSIPKPINRQGELDPADVNLPERITLHFTGGDGGFQRVAPRPGCYPMIANALAPTEGYLPDLTIEKKRLKEMRLMNEGRTDAIESFYVRVNGHYGKGYIEWSGRHNTAAGKAEPANFNGALMIQKRAGDRDLTWLPD